MLKFWNGSTNVLVIYICHLIWTVDNVNTRTALELLRELIGEVNIYMASARSTDRTPNRMILKNIATYITSLFKVSTHYWWAPTPLHCSRLLPEKLGRGITVNYYRTFLQYHLKCLMSSYRTLKKIYLIYPAMLVSDDEINDARYGR